EKDPICPLIFVFDLSKIVSQKRIEVRGLRRVERYQRIVRRLSGSTIQRDWSFGGLDSGVALVTTSHRAHGVENRNVNDGHGAARTTGAKLFSENPGFAGSDWRVVQTTRVYRDFIPAM